MKVSIYMELPIKAIPVDNHYKDLDCKEYDVEDIRMGQSGTSILLTGKDAVYNSIHFKFMLHGKEIDIYESGAFNTYRRFHLPLINYEEKGGGFI